MNEYHGTLTDDDGILVISTTQHMAPIGSRGFNYDYPAELLALMAEGRIVAWETGGEDDFSVEVVFADKPPDGSFGPFQLSVSTADTGLIMPYSQFSYAADCVGGVVSSTPGLSMQFPIQPGEYHVFVTSVKHGFKAMFTPALDSPALTTNDLPFISSTGS